MVYYKYPRPALTADSIVIAGGSQKQVLLIKRGQPPYKDFWALPGGFVNLDETLETASIRELKEETGVEIEAMTQFKTFDAIDRDPRHRTISVVYFAFIPETVNVTGGDDAAEAKWFPVNNLPELAFDHSSILSEFINYQKLD